MKNKNHKEIEDLDLGDLNVIRIDDRPYAQMWKDLCQVEGFQDYLRETMALDMKRYFLTNKETQDLIKGHYGFAKYLLSAVRHHNEKLISDTVDKKS